MPATLAKLLTVRELAQMKGVTPQTIRNWLRKLDERSGGKVIVRTGRGPTSPMKTTLRLLHNADARLVETRDLEVERIAVELRRVNGARVRSTVQTAMRELTGEMESQVKSTMATAVQDAVRELVSIVDSRLKRAESLAGSTSGAAQTTSPTAKDCKGLQTSPAPIYQGAAIERVAAADATDSTPSPSPPTELAAESANAPPALRRGAA